MKYPPGIEIIRAEEMPGYLQLVRRGKRRFEYSSVSETDSAGKTVIMEITRVIVSF